MNFFRTKARRAWAMMMVLGAMAAGCGDPAAPLPAEGAPDEFAFNIGGYGTGSTGVRMDGGAVVVTHRPWDSDDGPPESVRTVPSASDWAAFWAAAEQAGVRRWQREYRADHIVDGLAWSLELAGGGVAIQSVGINAYPDRQGDEHEVFPPADFMAFLDALGTLTGWDFVD
jgi:hypothetical protein